MNVCIIYGKTKHTKIVNNAIGSHKSWACAHTPQPNSPNIDHSLLPAKHLSTLMYLIQFFCDVARESESNKMDVSNLAIALPRPSSPCSEVSWDPPARASPSRQRREPHPTRTTSLPRLAELLGVATKHLAHNF